MKTQTNYKMCKKFWNFDKSPLFNRCLFHNQPPGKKTSLPGTKKRFKIFCILSTITHGTRKTPTFQKQWKMCKNRKPLYVQRSKWDSFLDKNGTLISFLEEFIWVTETHKKSTFSLCFLCKKKKRWRRKWSTTKSTNELSNTNCSISRKVILQKHQKLVKIARFWASKCGRE